MYSNFITPPDFVDDKFHTVTVVNATDQEVELLGRMCQGSDDQFNIYLYKEAMNDLLWLKQAVHLSDAVIVNTDGLDTVLEDLLVLDKTRYYGQRNFLVKAQQVQNVFQYFAVRYHKQNK